MISKFFIERPVLANVLAILFVLIGGVSLWSLPVAQYPNVTPPTIQVSTRYPGASAETVMATIALPVEQAVNGVDRMIYMQSTSGADGQYVLTVTFEIGTNLDTAQVLVQNRVSSALAQLPTAVQAQGLNVQQKSTAILEIVTLTSSDPKYDSLYLSNYATLNIQNELARLPGVGGVGIFGAGEYAMRVWLDPDRLLARGLTAQDVVAAIQLQSQQVAGGQIGAPPVPTGQAFQYTVNVQGRLADPREFGMIVVKATGGAVTRLSEVGRVELGAKTYAQTFRSNGAPAAGISITQNPTANALDVAARVETKMKELAEAFPAGLSYGIPFDTTKFVSASIHEVYRTLIEAAVLVLIVILVFLQDWRAMLVPATTVPVTIIGAFAAMAALGFSVNLSTLFAVILAIGIVVDDAIVVVEGAAHHMEHGLSAHDSAIKAMDELFGPIIGITLVLMSVFVPAAFLPGLTGRIYAQFALVIASTALISAINAATLKPTQCALWLRAPVPPEKRNLFFRSFNAAYDRLQSRYAALIAAMTGHSRIMVVVALAISGAAVWGVARLPSAFIPMEDQGYVVLAVQLPGGASLGRTDAVVHRAAEIAAKVPGVDQVLEIAGISPLDGNASVANAAAAFVVLKSWEEREKAGGQDLRTIYTRLQRALDTLPDGRVVVVPPPPIQGIGNSSGFTMQIEARDGSFDWQNLSRLVGAVEAAAKGQTALQNPASTFDGEAPQIELVVDRTKVETMQVSMGDVFGVLSGYIGSTYVNQFNWLGRTYQVYVQADAPFRLKPADLDRLHVRSQTGAMVPLGSLATLGERVGPSLITLYNLRPAAALNGQPASGYSSGEAMAVMEDLAAHVLPKGAGFDWTAMSYQEKVVGGQIYVVFGMALILVYLCLAGQYESWILPVAVLLSVPLALVGPALALSAIGMANNLYTQIGMILLIALAAKNAILIVEVARENRAAGAEILDSALRAAVVRFRPILMTSFAFILGVVPLVTATGAGASARVSLGMAVLTGMLASTCLAVLFVPSFYVVLQHFEERFSAPKRRTAES
jgi:HAE1 family hydrophobic/amphiphilic exporter-1